MKKASTLKRFFHFLSIVLFLSYAGSVVAAEAVQSKEAVKQQDPKAVVKAQDPVTMLKTVTKRVMDELKTHRSEIRQNHDKIYALVDHLILPHVDFIEMARWVVGRNAWKEANHATQKQFVVEFKTMVVRSYARSLLEYTDQEIVFLPLRDAVGDQQRVQVSSLIKDSGQSPTHMNYNLIREKDGSWRVYDIIIEGVSLVQGYRAQFADDIREGGVAKATETMQNRNHSG